MKSSNTCKGKVIKNTIQRRGGTQNRRLLFCFLPPPQKQCPNQSQSCHNEQAEWSIFEHQTDQSSNIKTELSTKSLCLTHLADLLSWSFQLVHQSEFVQSEVILKSNLYFFFYKCHFYCKTYFIVKCTFCTKCIYFANCNLVQSTLLVKEYFL